MKSVFKASFILVILLSIFNVGVTSTWAKEVKLGEIDSKLDIIQQNKLTNKLPKLPKVNYQANFKTDLECEPQTKRDGNTVTVITSECYVRIYQIDPTKS